MKVMRSLPGVVVALFVAGGTFCGLHRMAASEPAAPPSTPPPRYGLPSSPDYPVINEEGVPLWRPLPEPLELPVAGSKFLVPAGATVSEVVEGPRAVNVSTGEPAGPPAAHPHFWLISRNQSSVRIDAQTAELFWWDVKAEDEADFEALRHPRVVP